MEQSATPWRVFDAPANGDGGESSGEERAASSATKPPTVAGVPTTRLAIAGVAGAIVIGALAVVLALSGSGGQIVDAPDASSAGPGAAAMLAGGGDIVVDVTGAVTKPGVYHLPGGSRIGDAIDAAGGFSPRVDAGKVAAELNLAETVKDGSRVHVPSRDDPVTGPNGSGTGGSGASGGAGSGGGGRLIDLNTATASELDSLPGIGPVTAAKIIDSRTTTPFTSIDELKSRKLVGEKTFDQLKSLVTVR